MLVCGLWMPTVSVPKKMFSTVAARSVNIILVDCRYAVSAAAMLLQLLLLRIYRIEPDVYRMRVLFSD